MPERADSLVIASAFAAAVLLCLNATASSATECQERAAEPGHQYYHWDWPLHPECGLFGPAEVTTETPVSAANAIPDRPAEATQSASPEPARRNKTVRRERPQIAPPLTTTGAADRGDQPKQSASVEKQVSPFNEADRESLFQDFVKWQLDRNLFGRP